jgi:hypothetical protein
MDRRMASIAAFSRRSYRCLRPGSNATWHDATVLTFGNVSGPTIANLQTSNINASNDLTISVAQSPSWHSVCRRLAAAPADRRCNNPHRQKEQHLNLRQAIELTGIVSAHSPNLIEAREPLPTAALDRYHDASQARIQSWLRSLDELPQEIIKASAGARSRIWQRAEPMLIDVLAGELMARVWGAVLTACGRARRTTAAEHIARDVLKAQIEARERVLRLLTDGPHLTLERVVKLDRLQKSLQRWTDLFLGHLVRRHALKDFPFDLERCLDFGEEQLRGSWEARQDQVWELYFVCVRSLFPAMALPVGIYAEWRDEIFRSMLACLAGPLFLDDGLIKSVRLRRLLTNGTLSESPPAPVPAMRRESGAKKLSVSRLREGQREGRKEDRG